MSDRRADIEAAFESLDNEAIDTPASQEATPVEPVEATDKTTSKEEGSVREEPKTRPFGQEKARGEDGKYLKSTTKAPTPGKPVVTVKPQLKPATQTETKAPEAGKPTGTEFKAPQSWKPQAKEAWSKAPPEVQAEVMRREKEIARAMQDFAPVKQRDDAWRQVVEPHMQMFQAQGANPLAVVSGVLRTVHTLTYGTSQQKAQALAGIYKAYPVDINEFAAALDGVGTQTPQPQQQPQYQPQQFRDPRLDQLLEQRQRSIESSANREAEDFASKAEFMDNDEVREAMADALEWAASRNKPLTLEQAHKMALNSNPDIQEALSQRQQAQAATAQQAIAQRARRASSSIRSEPAGQVAQNGAPPSGRRAHIAAAYAEQFER